MNYNLIIIQIYVIIVLNMLYCIDICVYMIM